LNAVLFFTRMVRLGFHRDVALEMAFDDPGSAFLARKANQSADVARLESEQPGLVLFPVLGRIAADLAADIGVNGVFKVPVGLEVLPVLNRLGFWGNVLVKGVFQDGLDLAFNLGPELRTDKHPEESPAPVVQAL